MTRWRLLFWATLNVAANLLIAWWFASDLDDAQSAARIAFDLGGAFAWSAIAIVEWNRDAEKLERFECSAS